MDLKLESQLQGLGLVDEAALGELRRKVDGLPLHESAPARAPLPEHMAHLQAAAINGSAAGQYALACHYEIGAGVPLDRARARASHWAGSFTAKLVRGS